VIAVTDGVVGAEKNPDRQRATGQEWIVMGADTRQSSTTRMGLGRALAWGAAAGVLASLAMAVYAMIASWTKDAGLFTPLYHIASLLTSPDSMMASMEAGMGGDAFHVELGPAAVGAVIHMMTGAAYGAVFAVIVHRLALGRALLVAAGVVWGAVVFALSTWIGLPIAAAVFDAGEPIRNMAEMAGWGTFVVEHLLFGLVLGLVLAFRSSPERLR
jgi:hypothetical protein